jgi:DNA-binding XRE family transcriptional regulator
MNTDLIYRTMRDFLLEASPDEINDLAREAGLNPEDLARSGRSAVQSAIERCKQDIPKEDNVIQFHEGLNSLLVMLRRRDGLDEAELAKKADIDEEEIRRIEYDPAYLPNPRAIYKLEKVFALPPGVLAKLSGAIIQRSPGLQNKVLEFAANAKSIGKLTKDERELLNEFVSFLAKHH